MCEHFNPTVLVTAVHHLRVQRTRHVVHTYAGSTRFARSPRNTSIIPQSRVTWYYIMLRFLNILFFVITNSAARQGCRALQNRPHAPKSISYEKPH